MLADIRRFALLALGDCSVTTPEFAKEEDQSIAKLQASNDIVQGAIDQQRFVRHAMRAQPVLLAAEDDRLIGFVAVPPLLRCHPLCRVRLFALEQEISSLTQKL